MESVGRTRPVESGSRDLQVWQLGIKLAVDVYQLTQRFPRHEVYALINQTRRCAASIPANIAEGNSRSSTKEYLRHLSIARGSLAELETFLLLAERLQYALAAETSPILAMCDEESRMLRGLQISLETKLR